jgi:hypothetical protein
MQMVAGETQEMEKICSFVSDLEAKPSDCRDSVVPSGKYDSFQNISPLLWLSPAALLTCLCRK